MKVFNLIMFFVLSLVAIVGSAKPITGITSYYHPSLHGGLTANGEHYNHHSFTAAHRSLPFGTKLKVTDPETHRFVIVKVNDRGPFVKGRVLDLSGAAARSLGIKKKGIAAVEITVLSRPKAQSKVLLASSKKSKRKVEIVTTPSPLPFTDSIETLLLALEESTKQNDSLMAHYL